MKQVTALVFTALLCSTLVFANDAAQAQETRIHINPRAANAAPHIVNGLVVSTVTVELDGEPHRVSHVQITSSIKGALSGSVLVEVPGGEFADGTYMFVSHTPDFLAGSQVQIALTETPGTDQIGLAAGIDPALSVYSVVGGTDGAYGLLPDGIGRAAAVGDYSLNGAKWADFSTPVPFWVNAAGSGLSATATQNAVRQAFQMWEDDPLSNVDFKYEGATTKSGVDLSGPNHQSVVSWVNPPAGAGWLAQASWIATSQGSILEFDIRVSRNFNWSVGASPGKWDIATTVGHEVGHGLGFNHAPASSEIMYFQISSGRAKGLGPGDRSGLQALYPAPYDGPTCNGEPVTVNLATGQGSATNGRDVILGTPGDDRISALGGDDVICGGLGVDYIYGGTGKDLIFGGGGSDWIYGQAGADTIHAGSGADRVFGGPAADNIRGNGGQDRLWGEAGNDTIQGNWESDRIYGGPGDDILRGAGGKDKIWGQAGNDLLAGGVNTDYLNGGPGYDTGDGQRGRDYPLVSGVSGCEQLELMVSC